jgi:hypothetical protein
LLGAWFSLCGWLATEIGQRLTSTAAVTPASRIADGGRDLRKLIVSKNIDVAGFPSRPRPRRAYAIDSLHANNRGVDDGRMGIGHSAGWPCTSGPR